MLGLEVLLALQRPPDGPIDRCLGSQGIVVQMLIRCIDPLYAPVSLLPQLIRVGQAPERYSVGSDAVPALGSGYVLDHVGPFLRGGDVLMLMAIPFGVLPLVLLKGCCIHAGGVVLQ